MAYSATVILPVETKTDSFRSRNAMDTCYNGLSVKGWRECHEVNPPCSRGTHKFC
ncbi:outer membrane protein assembly factor BamC [Sesbania bispinosa]|nr:outer membrane protein assembly factor BamC [Sesbania bispinosa]